MFAGLALDGTALTIDDDANELFYGKPDILASDIIGGKIRSNDDSARRFMTAVSYRHRDSGQRLDDHRPGAYFGSFQRCPERRSRTDAHGSSDGRNFFPDGRSEPGDRESARSLTSGLTRSNARRGG